MKRINIHNSTNNLSMLSLACRDTGAKVIECDYVARGMTEEELWRDGTEHIVKAHGMKVEDITPQFKNYYKQYIKHSENTVMFGRRDTTEYSVGTFQVHRDSNLAFSRSYSAFHFSLILRDFSIN